ncbi:HlyD family secretion protein [Prochlorococcus sp. MIT 1307]|uniref:HlyD family secretion protein n=1 Tax=Prochlorococcus sp. MIT 1307 TaxID=3096219 RepID=UPI002A75CB27|nr:HlyD family efflux transporter periplasmic adaptor subunit [Prochlorococcus sp. MIT 1307]
MSISDRILSILRRFQSQVEEKAPLLEADQNVLQQSRFFMRAMTWSLIVTTGCGISWLALAKTDEIVMVQGKLEPIGKVKEIQIPVGGVIKEILVKSGERVKKGQILIVLDKEASNQNVKSLRAQLVQKNNQLKLKRMEKQNAYELINERMELLREKYILELKITQRLKFLLEEGAIAELQYLQQSQKRKETLGEISEKKKEGERQQLLLDQQLETINSEISQLEAKKTEANVLLKYKSVRTPVDGVIFDLKPTATGFVAQSSEPILKVVPLNKLEASVSIPSNKIGFVRIGMPTEISVDSFPASDFGSLKGEVISIGSDALPVGQEREAKEYQFPAIIRLKSQQLNLKNGTALPLQTGMSLRANIKLRRVTYLQLLLGSFKDKSESLKKI